MQSVSSHLPFISFVTFTIPSPCLTPLPWSALPLPPPLPLPQTAPSAVTSAPLSSTVANDPEREWKEAFALFVRPSPDP